MSSTPSVATPSAPVAFNRAPRRFDNFEQWRDDQIDRDPKRQVFFDQDPAKVRATFENNAEHADGKLVFDQVFRVNIWRKG